MSEPKRAVRPRYLDGDALRSKRMAALMEQAELAERCGTTQQQISKWERGDYGCRLAMIATLAEHLGCEPGELMLTDTPKGNAAEPARQALRGRAKAAA